MACIRRNLVPSKVANVILKHLSKTANARNEAHPERTKISAMIQTDDPSVPGKIRIDVDYPTDPEKQAIKNHYIARLLIDAKTGEMKFFPDGYKADEKIYELSNVPDILSRMCATIRTSLV